MIGNDVIDLEIARAERKSENFRYMAKVFSVNEKEYIQNSEDAELSLWVLWAMKETAYKAHQRTFDLPRKLNPKAYFCEVDLSRASGRVSISESVYDIKFDITSQYIHTTTTTGKLFQKLTRNKNVSALDLLSEIFEKSFLNSKHYKIKKNQNGIPSFVDRGTLNKIPFSFSHHGKFSAFAIPLINS